MFIDVHYIYMAMVHFDDKKSELILIYFFISL
jgi:hypothetical protein